MTNAELSRALCAFIERCPSSFHTTATAASVLREAGFTQLSEGEAWQLARGGRYFVMRNGSSIIAFAVGEQLPTEGYHFQMAAAHTDSPTFKVKHVSELSGPGEVLRLNVEGYGGMLDATWFDRPLGIAGRVMVQADDGHIESRLVESLRDVALIPSVAIHQRRDANKGYATNHQVDLCPLFSAGELKQGAFDAMVAELAGVEPAQLLAKELVLVNRTPARVWGWAEEFVSAPRLDDLQCAYAALQAFVAAENSACVTVLALFDNEEVGSGTKQGALSTFLQDVLVRVNAGLGFGQEDYLRALAGSFMVSCDNGHAVHPNHPELYDSENGARLNGGVVVKETSSQKYATDALSRAVFTAVCQRAEVPVQTFANRSDSAGGSTLGNLSGRKVSVNTVDVGLAQLAMHSSYETAGVRDTGYLLRALQAFYEVDVQIAGDGSVRLG